MWANFTNPEHTLDIIERLVATPKSDGGYDWTSAAITSANFPTIVEPSLEGAQLDQIVGPTEHVLAVLKSRGRRGGSAAETLLFGQKKPEELLEKGWIWGLGQTWSNPIIRNERQRARAVILYKDNRGTRNANTYHLDCEVREMDRVLSFPL